MPLPPMRNKWPKSRSRGPKPRKARPRRRRTRLVACEFCRAVAPCEIVEIRDRSTLRALARQEVTGRQSRAQTANTALALCDPCAEDARAAQERLWDAELRRARDEAAAKAEK